MIIDAVKGKPIRLGRLGENEARIVKFDVSDVLSEHPNAVFAILNELPDATSAYPVAVANFTVSGKDLFWTLTNADVSKEGLGRCELFVYDDNVICKSYIYNTIVETALDGSGEPPEPWESWVEEVLEAANLLENANATAVSLQYNEEATASYSDGTFTFGIPRGVPGSSMIDDTAGAGTIDRAWSADKDVRELAKKADKVSGTNGNFAGLDGNGNLTDSGKKSTDFVPVGRKVNGHALSEDVTVTKGDVGLGNVDNTSDADKPVSTATQSALDGKADKVSSAANGNFAGLDSNGNLTDSGHKHSDYIQTSTKGVANGVAELDGNGKVPSSQLPSYVDDVLEYANKASFPATGESGKIYIALDTNKTYRWGGTAYVEISESLALGETSSTAYRGDRGKTAYDHASAKGNAYVNGFYRFSTNAQGHVDSVVNVTKSDITRLGIPAQDTTYNDATQSVHGLMSVEDKIKLDGLVVASVAETQAIIDEYGEVSA